jgi:phosphate transport system ATP-binding protein
METTKHNDSTIVAVVENLSVSFGPRQVLRNINLSLKKGRLYVLLGRSGVGKTTFFRSFNRLNECFPHCQTRGSLRLNLDQQWLDIYGDGLSVTELRRRVGMVFQTPSILPASIERNISLPLKLVLGLGKNDIPARVDWALRHVHLWEEVHDRLQAPAANLSGGQQQRLCLARVLALEPALLLLDEPTASLDFRSSRKIEDLLLTLKEHYPILAVSHSLSQARRLGDEILVMQAGSLVRTLSRQDFQDKAMLEDLLEEVF